MKEAIELYLEDEDAQIPAGTLKSVIRQAGMTEEEFIKLL